MAMSKNITLLALLAILVSGCAVHQGVDSSVYEQSWRNLATCTSTARRDSISYCTVSLIDEIQKKIPNSDPSKPMAMRMAYRMHELLQKVEKGDISQRDAAEQWTRIVQETRQDAAQAAQMEAQVNAADSDRRRALLLNAQQILTQPYSNTSVINCSPQRGAPSGTFYCH